MNKHKSSRPVRYELFSWRFKVTQQAIRFLLVLIASSFVSGGMYVIGSLLDFFAANTAFLLFCALAALSVVYGCAMLYYGAQRKF